MTNEIKLCEECGNPFRALFYERYCPECYSKFEREAFLEEAAAGNEVYCGDNPVCPWCGKEYCLSVTVSYSYDATRELPKWMAEDRRKAQEERKKYAAFMKEALT